MFKVQPEQILLVLICKLCAGMCPKIGTILPGTLLFFIYIVHELDLGPLIPKKGAWHHGGATVLQKAYFRFTKVIIFGCQPETRLNSR